MYMILSFPCRAVAIGTSADHGIIGTCDGLVYMWELSTGMKLRDLHSFKGIILQYSAVIIIVLSY